MVLTLLPEATSRYADSMHTTNYQSTFIQIAPDCPVEHSEVPRGRGQSKTIAQLQYELLTQRPYELTSDEVLFEVHMIRKDIAETQRDGAREEFFSKPQACLRASSLPKRHGWGLHHDVQGRVALIALGSEQYRELSENPDIKQLVAMRSKRA